MAVTAEARGFLLVFPEGQVVSGQGALNGPSWNAGGCCASATADDLGFSLALVADVQARTCVAAAKVFACGWSAGAYFSHYLGLVGLVSPFTRQLCWLALGK